MKGRKVEEIGIKVEGKRGREEEGWEVGGGRKKWGFGGEGGGGEVGELEGGRKEIGGFWKWRRGGGRRGREREEKVK